MEAVSPTGPLGLIQMIGIAGLPGAAVLGAILPSSLPPLLLALTLAVPPVPLPPSQQAVRSIMMVTR